MEKGRVSAPSPAAYPTCGIRQLNEAFSKKTLPRLSLLADSPEGE
jgi:hypothetical protein